MFSPTNYHPNSSISSKNPTKTLATSFNRNFHDMRWHSNFSGRDSYIQDNNGGFTVSNDVQRGLQSGKMQPNPNLR